MFTDHDSLMPFTPHQLPGETSMTLSVDTSRITAGRRTDTYLAMRSLQGGRTVYSARAPLLDLDKILPVLT
jgi:hypothetical protein